MKLSSVSIQNFRSFLGEVVVKLDDLTTIVGRNEAGKSTVLEALEVFFNNDVVQADNRDLCVFADTNKFIITCEFDELPASLTLDAGATTTLAGEYLLGAGGTLKIRKIFDTTKKAVSVEVCVVCLHPTATGVDNLLSLKEKELQKLVRDRRIDVDLKGNPRMRQAIWNSVPELNLREGEVFLSRAGDDGKKIWAQLEKHLPLYALFQSDRRSQDSDDEVQNPMKAAVAAAIAEVQDEIENIQRQIESKTREIAKRTHLALRSLDENLAKELTPQFTAPTPAKWSGLFSVNLVTENGIPLNKRGSGIRRMILVSFFKAEAERKLLQTERRSIIYAVEEPETSQHPNNQRVLIQAFKDLAAGPNCQVLLTTHSPGLAADLPTQGIRYLHDVEGKRTVKEGADVFREVAQALGVVPDSRVKVLVCVEGPTDVTALQCLSRALSQRDISIPDLSSERRVAFVVLGGSTLKHWVTKNYLGELGRPEVHIYDNDQPKYQESVNAVNARSNGSWGTLTSKYEIESYLHPDAIRAAFDVEVEVFDGLDLDGKATPKRFAEALSIKRKFDGIMGDTKAKQYLADHAFPLMNAELIDLRDPDGEVRGWFRRIAEILDT